MALLGVERPEAAIAPTGVPIAECPECPVAYIVAYGVLALLAFVGVVAIVVGFAAIAPVFVE